jgi:hypothetical protein
MLSDSEGTSRSKGGVGLPRTPSVNGAVGGGKASAADTKINFTSFPFPPTGSVHPDVLSQYFCVCRDNLASMVFDHKGSAERQARMPPGALVHERSTEWGKVRLPLTERPPTESAGECVNTGANLAVPAEQRLPCAFCDAAIAGDVAAFHDPMSVRPWTFACSACAFPSATGH